MRVLAIGNSFSEDATRYLHQVAKADGFDMKVVNLYIGGCPLSLHYKNLNNDYKAYDFQFNGVSTGLLVSIKELLENDLWDYVTVQQVSHLSMNYDSYQPYLNALVDYIHKYCPKAKILIHQTWGYKPESNALKNLGYKNHIEMYKDVKSTYKKIANELGFSVISAGKAMEYLVKNGLPNSHRDDIHASLGVGRLTLAMTWYKYLTGNSIENIKLDDCLLDEAISEKELVLAKLAVNNAVK